jgi:hypothetical protein
VLPIAIYFSAKYAAYAAWCGLGLRWLDPSRPARRRLALLFGAMRLGLGFLLGFLLWNFPRIPGFDPETMLGGALPFYFVLFPPMRWLEWSLVALLLDPSSRSRGAFLVGASARARLWRLGGVGLSFLADGAVFLVLANLKRIGFPVC